MTSLQHKPFFSIFLHVLIFLPLHMFYFSSFFVLADHTSSKTSIFGTAPSAANSKVAGGNIKEAEALLKWKASLDDQSQSLLSSWVGTSPCMDWIGISCDGSGSVANLTFPHFGLRGSDAVSDVTHKLSDQIKKFLASGAVSDFIHTPFDLIKKKFTASDAASDFNIRKLSDLTKKFLASETVVDVLRWLKKESVPIMVAVVAIALLFGGCCGGAAKSVKTMKAPGRNYRMPRSNFEANPSAYFRGLRKG